MAPALPQAAGNRRRPCALLRLWALPYCCGRWDRGDYRVEVRSVARVAVAPLVADAVPRAQHECSALLGHVALTRALAEAAPEGEHAPEHRERMIGAGPAVLEPRGAERAPRRIHVEGPLVAGHLAEGWDVVRLGGTDHHQERAPVLDLRQPRLEASDLLATEDSAEVADEGQHHRTLGPQALEWHRDAGLVEHGALGEGGREQIVHGMTL